ncbi:DUF305 domain-containing protein [Nonomuraea sp. NPDC046570]|uniref:DUF305 domain-containing protein n=1 Tax=Nonomuraea sp. NPDC046570 TaxID=3155255 RepID=UPI0033E7AD17
MRVALIVVAGVLALTVAACTDSPAPAPRADSTAPVLAPGRPGEAAKTLSPSEAAVAVPTQTANAADVTYVKDMIVHHRQALDMAVLAPTRAESAQVKGIASRIKDAQGPEIQFMTDWLTEQGQSAPEHHAAHQGMAGMATPEQMERLKAASGKDFDRMFLTLMIAHHQGAIQMSETVLRDGAHMRIEELAADVSVTQMAEIRRMQAMMPA